MRWWPTIRLRGWPRWKHSLPRDVDIAVIGRIYETEMSEGDRSCFLALLANPASVQVTSAGTGHCRLYEQLAGVGWAAQDFASDLTKAVPFIRVWQLTDEGRARIPGMLVVLSVNHETRQLRARRARHLAGFGVALVGLALTLYGAVFIGIGSLLSGEALKVADAFASVLLLAVLFCAFWLAVWAWAERPFKGQFGRILGRLEFLKANRLGMAVLMAAALVLIGFGRLGLRLATGVDLPPPTQIAVQITVVAAIGFAVGWYLAPSVIGRRINRQFIARP